jgi:hypothetical protein
MSVILIFVAGFVCGTASTALVGLIVWHEVVTSDPEA